MTPPSTPFTQRYARLDTPLAPSGLSVCPSARLSARSVGIRSTLVKMGRRGYGLGVSEMWEPPRREKEDKGFRGRERERNRRKKRAGQ